MIKIGGSVRCSQSAGPADPCARLLGPAPTCVQLPAVPFDGNRWRRNGKSLSPLAGPAFVSLFSLPPPPPPTVSQPFKAAVTLMPPHFSKKTAAAAQRCATFTYLPVRCSTCKCEASFFSARLVHYRCAFNREGKNNNKR